MKQAVLVAFLVVALCEQEVRGKQPWSYYKFPNEHTLWCFKCDNQYTNLNCLQIIDCQDQEKFCVTTTVSKGNELRISKQCSPACPNDVVNAPVLEDVSFSCCNTSFCNENGATSLRHSNVALLLPVGILASSFYGFQTVL